MHRPPPHSPRQFAYVGLLLALLSASHCTSKRQIIDRDRGLIDTPVREGVAVEPLTGDLADGARALHDGEVGEAKVALERYLATHPKSALACYHLGLVAIEQERPVDAKRLFQQAFNLNSQLHGALTHLGVLYLRSGEEVAAIRALEQALAMAPDDVRVLANVAAARLLRGQWSEAIDAYKAALKIAPGHGSLLYDYALALMQRMQWQPALEALDEALSIRPQFARAWAAKVVCLQGMDRIDEAEATANQADEVLLEKSADNHVARARILVLRKQVGDAMEQLQRAVALEPGNPGALLALGELADAAGRKALAVETYQKFLKNPARRGDDSKRIRDRLKLLQSAQPES